MARSARQSKILELISTKETIFLNSSLEPTFLEAVDTRRLAVVILASNPFMGLASLKYLTRF